MSPVGGRHGWLVVRLASLLDRYVEEYRLGAVMTETGFQLASNPDTVRGPDVSFVRAARIPPSGLPDTFWLGAPDLAAEIRSPGDRLAVLRLKIDEYLACGTSLVWLVDPGEETVTVFAAQASPVTIGVHGSLDGATTVPGFSCPVAELFKRR